MDLIESVHAGAGVRALACTRVRTRDVRVHVRCEPPPLIVIWQDAYCFSPRVRARRTTSTTSTLSTGLGKKSAFELVGDKVSVGNGVLF